MTDDARLPDPLAAVRALPAGSMVIVRARDGARRAQLARQIVALNRKHALKILVAGDVALAARLRADGVHLAEAELPRGARLRARHPGWLITVAAHHARSVTQAHTLGLDAVLLSPVFPTESHRGAPALGIFRCAAIARAARLPVYALGGVDARNAVALAAVAGIAAIGALQPHK
jgi:thiamine-phosphate pyrophosphorylase